MDLLEKAKKSMESKKETVQEVKKKPEPIKIIGKKLKKTKRKITGDKLLNKSQMIEWFTKLLQEKGDIFTLDYLRGQKLNFESVYEMRK